MLLRMYELYFNFSLALHNNYFYINLVINQLDAQNFVLQ